MALVNEACYLEGIVPGEAILHSDNGSPIKGATMLSTLQRLGAVPSFSRPRGSDDNPYSEVQFRTLKYHPDYLDHAFPDLVRARAWVKQFARWYNTKHQHSSINFVTPHERHSGIDRDVLTSRDVVYNQAKRRRPNWWTRTTGNWTPVGAVTLHAFRPKQQTQPESITDSLKEDENRRATAAERGNIDPLERTIVDVTNTA